MNRKKNIVKLILLFSVVVGIIGVVPSNAISLTLNFNKAIPVGKDPSNSIRPIHFREFKNDFGGLFYFMGIDTVFNREENEEDPVDVLEDYKYVIEDTNDGKTFCKDQIRGFYYNAERGERLRPIDSETLHEFHMEDQGLTMTGGIFTNCSTNTEEYIKMKKCCTNGEDEACNLIDPDVLDSEKCIQQVDEKYADPYSYYGGITHEYSGQTFILAMGIKYATGTTWIETKPEIGRTFQRHPEEGFLPFGLIYDNLGGVGFAGCEIVEPTSPATVLDDIIGDLEGENSEIYKIFTVSEGSDDEEKYLVYTKDIEAWPQRINCKDVGQDNGSALKILVEGLIGMQKEEIEYYKAIDTTRSLQKTQYFASANVNNATMINHARQKAETLCRGKWDSSTSTTINSGINCLIGDRELQESDRNKTIIVKNGNVTIKPFPNNTNDYYDIFIDSGNLIIDESGAEKFVIKTNGFVSNSGKQEFIEAVSTAMYEGDPNNMWGSLRQIGIASILKGNFIVNGSIEPYGSTGLNNKYFVYGKLTSLDSPNKLNETFSWRCNNGNSNETEESEGYPCPGPNVGGKSNPYQDAPLVIIDQNYDSPLFK